MGSDERFGFEVEVGGARHQIGLVRFEEAQHRRLRRAAPGRRAQRLRIEPGQRQQPVGARTIVERPDERAKGNRCGIVCLLRRHRYLVAGGGFPLAKRVLVVEDNELNLKLFCDLLRAHEFAAEPVRDGREAVERARAFEPDLIVMDIQLPHVSGLELIERIRAEQGGLAETPIMAVTAYAGREDEDRIRAAGANAYVSKPISVSRFVEEVNALV